MKIKFKGKNSVEKNSRKNDEKYEAQEESLGHYQKRNQAQKKIEPVFGTDTQ